MWNNWQYRVLALLLALFCWYLVSGQEKVETWLDVPLEFVNLPQQMEITSGLVNKLQVRIRGTSNQVRSLNTGHLAYKLDLGKIQAGTNVIPLLPERMTVTSAVEVVEINPARLELIADMTMTKNVPITFNWGGLPSEDMRIRSVTVVPEQITISGLASVLETVDKITTERVQVPPSDEEIVAGRATLLLSKEVQTNVSSVSYELQFGLITQDMWIKMNLEPVEQPGFTYTFDPKFVRARLEMPTRLLKDRDWRDKLHMELDPGKNPLSGPSVVRPLPRLPENVHVLELRPEEIKIVVQREETDTDPAAELKKDEINEHNIDSSGTNATISSGDED